MQGALASPRDGSLPSPRVRPGFDGVLNDSWTARRRQAENVLKAGAGANRTDKETDEENKGPDIKEEEEEANPPDRKVPSGGTLASDQRRQNSEGDTNGPPSVDQVHSQLGNLSISGQGHSQSGSANKHPPGLGDLSDMDWSYLDPQGEVQGGSLLKILFHRLPHSVSSSSRAL